tara:strand:- start:875 stop:1825 length:951 start_codon:yes stop_codon:yes gene_type:complete
MGLLRKIGRRIKKRIKKLFSSKIGRVLGTIGLYFALGAAAKGLTGWLTSKFGAAASGAATDVTTTAVVEGAAADATTTAASSAAADVTTTAAVEGAGSTVSNSITTAGTNMEAANNAIAAVDASNLSTATNTISESVELFADEKILNDTIGTVSNSLQESATIDTKAATIDLRTVDPVGMPESESLLNPSFNDMGTFGDRFRVAGRKTRDYFVGEDSTFVPDTIAQLGTSAITSAFQEEEEIGGRGIVADRQIGEAAQAAHVQDVSAQLPQYAGLNANQLNQNLFYGTLSPQHLAQQAQEMQLMYNTKLPEPIYRG